MKNSQLSLLIEKVKNDDALRQKFIDAEESISCNMLKLTQEIDLAREANLDLIKKIAQEAGYDITMDISRPEQVITPTDQEIENLRCVFTCCLVLTSVLAVEEPTAE